MSSIKLLDQSNGKRDTKRRERPLILLAEDNDDTRGIYGLILRYGGYEVEEATNGATAVALTRRLRPNLVLMDIEMPGVDGWEATQILKSDPETICIPVVAFSTRIDSTADLAGRRTFDGYIMKPISPTELVRRVRSYCQLLEITRRRTGS